jgi:hypothetical protein
MDSKKRTQHPLAQLSFSSRVRKRAQYEAYEFALVSDGIRVRNASYADPENHEYTVTVRDGIPVGCSCPADARFEGACKHRVAVAIRRPLLNALNARSITDDGQPTADTH